uniref:Pathogen-related protein n=1 Tax=Fagus sylvatica TaxID=28930 RepID=A0A2N9E288_FAGSY
MMWRSKDHRSAGLWWSLLSSGGCLGGYGRFLNPPRPVDKGNNQLAFHHYSLQLLAPPQIAFVTEFACEPLGNLPWTTGFGNLILLWEMSPFSALSTAPREEGKMEWPKGSLEKIVQNAIKSWEMEVSHKTRLKDLKTINHEKFKLIVNGREGLSGEETIRLGTYNALLKNSLPKEFQYYKADEESFESSHDVFRSTFPHGFAWEVISVYSGPSEIAFKFRHWGYFEGPFKGNAPTGEVVQFYGLATLKGRTP